MKLNKYFMLGLAGLAFAACSNEDEVGKNLSDDNTPKTLIVSIKGLGDASTRADINAGGSIWAGDANATAAQGNIQNLAFFFTDGAGAVKYKYQIAKDLEESATEDDKKANTAKWDALFKTTGAKFVGLTGVTAVHVVANAIFDTNEFTTITNISSLSTTLKQQAPSIAKNAVVYVGSDKDMPDVHPEPATGITGDEEIKVDGAGSKGTLYYVAEVALKPIISRIQIKSIKVVTKGTILFPAADATVDGITATKEKYALPWENFKPTLHGIYLNRFAGSFNDLQGTVPALLDTDTYVSKMAGGDWKVNGTDSNKDEAAYISHDATAYGALLSYPTTIPADGKAELIPVAADGQTQKCIAFNVFVPFETDAVYNSTSGIPATKIANPSIHFQFDNTVTGYDFKDPTLADGTIITADSDDEKFIKSYEEQIAGLKTDYLLPTTEEYLFANINKLYNDKGATTELSLQPGKIYNMNVEITPVNMSIDLRTPKSYNVVVKVTVVPFTEDNIYPGLDE